MTVCVWYRSRNTDREQPSLTTPYHRELCHASWTIFCREDSYPSGWSVRIRGFDGPINRQVIPRLYLQIRSQSISTIWLPNNTPNSILLSEHDMPQHQAYPSPIRRIPTLILHMPLPRNRNIAILQIIINPLLLHTRRLLLSVPILQSNDLLLNSVPES
ncbi:hypothetical protein K469DRAFT_708525 [Zopfia rhizophila CBS 207.26]|uniref:Uncharacterized protein n=1 Tax=Zopfia rhizophila CBS 207.26 TaxID=1314779 RepID=A0A6A6E4F0_9PEZI|nr:hypothetical protein K469DRAFT_708525 [Zopfia rhizophila CBS 207.26]